MIRAWLRLTLGPAVVVAQAFDRAVGVRCPVVAWWAEQLEFDGRPRRRSDYHRAIRMDGR